MGITVIPQSLTRKNKKFGYYLIIAAAALSAIIHVVSKPMLENTENAFEINPVVLAFLVYFIAGIFFTPIAKKAHSISKFGKKDWMFMGLIGTAEVLALITYFYGLKTSTAVNASIFSNSEIIFALVIAMLIFKERLHIKECIPFSMIIIGMMIIPIGADLYQNDFSVGHLVTGDLLIILSGILYAIDITLCKYIGDRFDTKRVTQVLSFICAAVAISIIVAFEIPMDVDWTQLPGIMVISILGTGMSTLFFLMALKIIGTVRTVLLYSTTAMFGVLFSGLFLGEAITAMDVISLALVLGGIFMLRNRLAGKDKLEQEEIQKPVSMSRRRRSRKQARMINKISIRYKIENEFISKSWIGAG
jgi:drug/metabolite transporter (DMT)-like permease